MTSATDLKNLTARQLAEFVAGLGVPVSRARQIFAWVHRPGSRDISGMTGLRKELRGLLAGRATISRLEPARVERSRDGTVKYAFRLADGAVIESVLIPAEGRHTLCVSSQVGCAMGCRFCLTAGMGFQRNLTPAEIVNQVGAVQEWLIAEGVVRATPRQLIDNLVFMGMGEPLANYENLVTSLAILMDEHGPGFSERRVTVSTCGLVPRIRDLARDVRVNLAVSLHAVDDELRSGLMPVNRAHGVDALLEACRAYPRDGRRIVFFEYLMIGGVNDAPADARRLAEKLRDIPCRVNLLQYNESDAAPYRRSTEERVALFKDTLHRAGIRTLVRNSKGADISAACGQLAARALPDGRGESGGKPVAASRTAW
jgi:23S rRNA (adenine2503-C2)-methyltransferase